MTAERPRTRADCRNGPRPCPWLTCRYHLALDQKMTRQRFVDRTVQRRFEDGADDEVVSDAIVAALESAPHTCALDVAEEGAITLEDIGALLKVSRERVRQIEEAALLGLCRRFGLLELAALFGDTTRPCPQCHKQCPERLFGDRVACPVCVYAERKRIAAARCLVHHRRTRRTGVAL